MKKIYAIARTEYLQAVRSKAFLIGIILMPVLMGGSIAVQIFFKDKVDLTDRPCAIVDPTGELYPALAQAAEARNERMIWELQEDGEPKQLRPRFLLERFEPAAGERADLLLSERVREGELQGFLLIDERVLDADGETGERPLAYHTDEPTFTELSNWLGGVVNDEIRRRRFEAAQLDRELVSKLNRGLSLSNWGLVDQRSDGSVAEAEKENEGRTFGVPAIAMMLLFMLVMVSAPQLMNQVLEEKMQRISEVLVSAVTPFELMMGKLLGTVFTSLTLAALYIGGVIWATHHWGVSHFVSPGTYVWFVVMLLISLLMYGSMFSALGSACSELRDAQSMMMPAMLIVLIPLFAWTIVLESPNGTVAQVLTFVPTATPLILLLRLIAQPGPPLWEIVVGMTLCLGGTVVLVWASGKIFRIGVLAQGQTPSFRKLLTWVTAK